MRLLIGAAPLSQSDVRRRVSFRTELLAWVGGIRGWGLSFRRYTLGLERARVRVDD